MMFFATTARRWRAVFACSLLVLMASAVGVVQAEQFQNPKYGYYVNVPEGWKLIDSSNPAQLSWSDPTGQAVFQIVRYDPDKYPSVDAFATSIKDKLKADGDFGSFTYSGRPSILADLTFDTSVSTVRGYDIFIHGQNANYALLTYTSEDSYPDFHDFFLSALDSFAFGAESLLYPGPISEFFRPIDDAAAAGDQNGLAAGSLSKSGSKSINFQGKPIQVANDPAANDASQVLIEREARILETYEANGQPANGWQAAWARYYQMIFRDNYHRLDGLSKTIGDRLAAQNASKQKIATEVLSWLQGFTYARTGSLSDLQSPITCVANQSGDCDSLGLTYAIILQHLGINAILMVSAEYSHALAGVDVEGSGARFSFAGRTWLVAELTAPVAIGQISQNMADPSKWMGISLKGSTQPSP